MDIYDDLIANNIIIISQGLFGALLVVGCAGLICYAIHLGIQLIKTMIR